MDIIEANKVLQHLFRPLWKDIFNDKDISKVKGKLQALLKILPIEAVKAYTAADIAAIAAVQAELPNNSIKGFEEALALIKSNGNNIAEVNTVNELNWM